MSKKYQVLKLEDLSNWSKFESNSPQSNIFSSIESLKTYRNNLHLFEIRKGDEIKCLVYLYSEDGKNILSDPLIYSGILFGPQKDQKNCRYLSEKFNLTEIIIDKILINYLSIDINLHYNLEDIRPFQWLNYKDNNKPSFEINNRFTSIINIKNKSKEDVFKYFDDVKQRDIKKCENQDSLEFNHIKDFEILKKLYIKTIGKSSVKVSKEYLNKQFLFLENIYNSGKGFQTNILKKEKIIYSSFFSHHNNTACYLYGAGDYSIKERLSGTYCVWKSLEKCIEKKIHTVDMEGVNSPKRGSFKTTFGGDLKNYYNLKIKLN